MLAINKEHGDFLIATESETCVVKFEYTAFNALLALTYKKSVKSIYMS